MKIGILTDTHHGFSRLQNEKNALCFEALAKLEPELIIHSGDFGSHCLDNRKESFSLLRQIFPTQPIVGVLGNHDFWDERETSFSKMIEMNVNSAKENSIILLDGNTDFIFNQVYISGFAGWYYDPNPSTNDCLSIPQYESEGKDYLYSSSHKQLAQCLAKISAYKQSTGLPTMLITHFGFIGAATDWKQADDPGKYFGNNPKYEDYLFHTDYFVFGHSHKVFYGLADNQKTQCYNVGSNYEDPQYLMLEIDITKINK